MRFTWITRMCRKYMQAQLKEPVWLALNVPILLSIHLSLIDAQGTWEQLVDNAGIASMHTAITHENTAILLDRTNIGASEIKLPNGKCRTNNDELALKYDCTAHSVMFDPSRNTIRALFVQTDTWCSSGQFITDGTMVQTGGDFEGVRKVRRLVPCPGSGDCDWVESDTEKLTDERWYATNQILPDGNRQIVIGGRQTFTYEFVPKRRIEEGVFDLKLLSDTNTVQADNLYPFVHLLPSGNLFIFANRDSIIFDYNNNKVVRTFPKIPGEPRNYPSAGSSVLLPLDQANEFIIAEVLVCGGARAGAFRSAAGKEMPASQTCGRLGLTDANPNWEMETMPKPRTMGDMVILPNGDVLIINGAERGSQGWGKATRAVLTPVKYATYNADARFETLAAAFTPRVYHSTANLLTDGRILVAGSNSHQYYTWSGEFPTQLKLEAFSPPYLEARNNNVRPTITNSPGRIAYRGTFTIVFTVAQRQGRFEINMRSSPFVTHSYSMGQRLLKLKVSEPVAAAENEYMVDVTAPPSGELAPAGYYMLFPVQTSIPGNAVWVRIQ